jgi:adenylate cyclase
MSTYSPDLEARSPVQIAPPIAYHVRKLLNQNLSQLVPIVSGKTADSLSDLNAILEDLYCNAAEIASATRQLEHLGVFHQTLSTQGTQHSQQLREAEQKIFWLLGYKFQDKANQGKVLLVEGTPEHQQVLSTGLAMQGYEVQGYEVQGFSQGEAILTLTQQFQPDVILLDVQSGQDGYAICQQLKADPTSREIPVIFMGASEEVQSKIQAFEVGGEDYIVKPLQVREVIVRVEHQMKVRNLQKELAQKNDRLQQEVEERKHIEDRYRDMFMNAIDGLFQTTPDGCYIKANPSLAKIYGYESIEELISCITDISQQLYVQPGQRETMAQYLKEHGEILGAESQVYRKDGSTIWISESVRAVKDQQGELLYYEGIVRDMTERRKIEHRLRRHRKESEKLLQSILPQSIGDRLRKEPGVIADGFEEVTVLFADIPSFTRLSSQITPTEQVELLNRLFSAYDHLVEQHGLEKIKTIRDVYFAAGGVPLPKANHAEAIADMALAMLAVADQVQKDLGQPFQIRVGINTGAVVAGVLGTKRFTYDLWGDTVNVASRMQAYGLPGKIQVTPATYQRLQGKYPFEKRGAIEIHGIGQMETYWLTGK